MEQKKTTATKGGSRAGEIKFGRTRRRKDAKDQGREGRESAARGDWGVTALMVEKQGELANLQNGIEMSGKEAKTQK